MPFDRKKTTGIYRFLNVVSGYSYVGSSLDIAARRNQHLYLLAKGKSHSPKLQRAYTCYGPQFFKFEVLQECEPSALEAFEANWIAALNSVDFGYNCSADTTCATRGFKHSEETRKRMSSAQKQCQTPYRKQVSSATITAYNLSLKGKAKSEGHRRKISSAHTGKKLSEETKQKMRGRVVTEQTRAKLRGRTISEDTRLKLQEAQRGNSNRSKMVIQIALSGQQLAIHESAAAAARAIGIGRTAIKNCLRGLSKSAGGYRWRYV
jgi:group I intron endonuclease